MFFRVIWASIGEAAGPRSRGQGRRHRTIPGVSMHVKPRDHFVQLCRRFAIASEAENVESIPQAAGRTADRPRQSQQLRIRGCSIPAHCAGAKPVGAVGQRDSAYRHPNPLGSSFSGTPPFGEAKGSDCLGDRWPASPAGPAIGGPVTRPKNRANRTAGRVESKPHPGNAPSPR